MGKIKFDFSGECFVITGASSGLGRQVALDLAEAGAKILAIGRNTERLNAIKNEQIITEALDICDFNALTEAVLSFTSKQCEIFRTKEKYLAVKERFNL